MMSCGDHTKALFIVCLCASSFSCGHNRAESSPGNVDLGASATPYTDVEVADASKKTIELFICYGVSVHVKGLNLYCSWWIFTIFS